MPEPDQITFPIGSGGGEFRLSCTRDSFQMVYTGLVQHAIYVAVRDDLSEGPTVSGSSIIPFGQRQEGSTVFLPFAADRVYCASGNRTWKRSWEPMAWRDRVSDCPEFTVWISESGQRELTLQRQGYSPVEKTSIAIYVKDLEQNAGWGWMVGSCDGALKPGIGDKELGTFFEITESEGTSRIETVQRFHQEGRERIYELFVRLFGNTNTRRKQNGTLAENGCGKFNDITATAIQQIAAMNFTHIWLMGVVRHATTTSYDLPGLVADETDLMKGLAGSPYAVKDYFDVSPDLAVDPSRRTEEFKALVARIHTAGLKVIIDFVGNHVCRSYQSLVRPELSFGSNDDISQFFAPNNNFFYLRASHPGGGPPLRLPTYDPQTQTPVSPTCAVKRDCDGLFAGETTTGRVTGNNSVTWSPSLHDWYETVKLNYGFEFTGSLGEPRQFPNAQDVTLPIPDTWLKVDAVLAHWQAMGIDGFRCDMAHMVPPEFWKWCIERARYRNAKVFFMAEAYNDYFAVHSTSPDVLALQQQPLFHSLLHAGFNAVYGHDLYRVLKELYDGSKWANDIDSVLGPDFIANHSVCYSENHDELRLASPYGWGGIGAGVGKPVSAVLFGLGRGPVLFYNGQEVGEAAIEAEGFSGADGRTTIFDYWSVPALSQWANNGKYDGGQLSEEQRELRSFYSRLISLCGDEVFSRGLVFGLNPANIGNAAYGRLEGEDASGHWLYSFLRHDPASNRSMLVVVNLHCSHPFADVVIEFPREALEFLELRRDTPVQVSELLTEAGLVMEVHGLGGGLHLPKIPPLAAYYFSLVAAKH